MIAKNENSLKPIGTREWYDFLGQLSDILPGMHPGGHDATEALLEMCHLDASSQVLDIGCGSGNTACYIAEVYGSRVYGIDISEVMIAKANERAKQHGLTERLEFRVGDVFNLPFEDDWFDVVIVESVLTPLPGDKVQAMREMVRVVRPGGLIGANEGTVDPMSPPEFMALLEQHPATYGYFTPESLRSLFEESGLEVVEMSEAKYVDVPRPRMGLRDLVGFMIRVYPKLLLRLMRDRQIREASKVDDELTKAGNEYMGYALIIGQKHR
ncbi:MAG: methyltransferase domain-containing protein [Anaerolineales bacterium]|nr:methyltransferase domain-containing protein [Anaerolineales bacterium]